MVMCGILVSKSKVDRIKFMDGFKQIAERGPDQSLIEEVDGITFGFHRLAIMGLNELGMQPFKLNNKIVVCNGEIYGFQQLKDHLINDGYRFVSESDCEVLIPMYEQYGLELFKFLDAEFALVLYDGEKKQLIAARDPIGIRPLFYGYGDDGQIAFCSEAKGLVGWCHDIQPFPVGCFYDGQQFISYHAIDVVSKYSKAKIDQAVKGIKKLLIKGVEKRLVADAKVGFLLSGGLDSSLVCAIAARKSEVPIRTFAIGMATDAIDLKYAKQVAQYIGSDHYEVIITEQDVKACVSQVVKVLESYDITTVRASIGMYLLCKWIHQHTDIKVLLTGEVSDELFGYKYTDFAPNGLAFQQESEKRIRELYMYDVLRADRCLASNALEARVPFADLDFVEYVLSLQPAMKLNSYGMGKYLLRKAFEGDYLPAGILYREKAAFSDAVGHSLVDILKAEAEKQYSDEEFQHKQLQYSHCPPITKEALWYREMFESYYPCQGHWINGYWMPNKSWPNCQVNDPSARVLSNYGTSGQ
jgi:asparagine synthase (glutamine-hydrolysing)